VLSGWRNPPDECCGTWTPDGAYFVFQSRQGSSTQLWARREGRSYFWKAHHDPVKLTSAPASHFAPAINEDGTKLFALGVPDSGELVRYDGRLQQLVPYLGGISATWVAFFKDLQRYAYVLHPERTLWLASAAWSDKRQLTFPPFEVDGWSPSPDGKWIASRGRMPGRHYKIYLLPTEGGQPQPLTMEDVEQGLPTWSADGSKLAFGDVPEIFGHAEGTEVIHIYDVATRGLSELPQSHGLWTSRWSPDGRYLSALTIQGQKIALFDFLTRTWRRLEADHVNNPTWSRDSKYIYYDTEGGARALRRVRIEDGQIEQIVDLAKYPIAAYWWSGLASDDSPIVLRHVGAPEVFAFDFRYR
jgi:WD40 repeat protein